MEKSYEDKLKEVSVREGEVIIGEMPNVEIEIQSQSWLFRDKRSTNVEELFVLKYPEVHFDGESGFSKNACGMYVALDHNSGGYPYGVVSFRNASTFISLIAAMDYRQMFPYLDVYKVRIECEYISVDVAK